MIRTHWLAAGLVAAALLAGACGRDSANDAKSAASAPSSEQAAAAPRDAARMADGAAASGGSAPGSAPAQATNAAPPLTDRKLIFTVALDLVMKDVQGGFERIGQIAEANGGLVAESNFRQEGDLRRASVTIRVPVARYQEALAQIRGLAVKVDSERATANDVTEEYTDLQSRQRNLEATEQQLLVFLGQAKNVQEVLTVQDRLNATRAEIEKVKGRINLLSRLTDLATLQVQLRPEAAPVAQADPARGPLDALRAGWEASLDVVGGIGLALLTVAAFSWWLLPLAALAYWLLRREIRRRTAGPAGPLEAA